MTMRSLVCVLSAVLLGLCPSAVHAGAGEGGPDAGTYVNSLTSLIVLRDTLHLREINLYGRVQVLPGMPENIVRAERCKENLHEMKFGVREAFFSLDRMGRDGTHVDLVFGAASVARGGDGPEVVVTRRQDMDRVIALIRQHGLDQRCVMISGLFSRYATRERSVDLGGWGTIYVRDISGIALNRD